MGFDGKIAEELGKLTEVVEGQEAAKYQADRWEALRIEGARKGRAIAVVRPKNEDELVQVIRFCADNGLGVTCRGGGSSVTGASVPLDSVVIDMTAMNRILSVDEENMVAWVEAGAKLSDVEAELNRRGYTLGQIPQSFHLVTIGGYLSTMGTGEFSGAYGGAEESCLSLRVALADGSVVETRASDAPRTSVGPDTTRLFVGAEGAFGVIVSAKLKMHRLGGYEVKLAFRFGSFEAAMGSAKALLDLDLPPSVCRIYDENEASYQLAEASALMLLIYQFRSQRVAQDITGEVRELVTRLGGVEVGGEIVNRWLDIRFRYDEQLGALHAAGYIVETVELGSSWTGLAPLYRDITSRLRTMTGVAELGAHVSHIYRQGACLYLTAILSANSETYRKLWEAVSEACSAHRATVSHHHGVGLLKAEMAKREIPYALLEKIKRALDPKGTFNPGKLL